MKYSIEIDREGCIACAACYNTDPAHFEGDSEGKSRVLSGTTNGTSIGTFDDGLIEDARRAEASCPVSVITIKM